MNTKEKKTTLDDIIFEQRNKDYGAYFLRKNYKKHVIFALCFTLGVLMMSMSTPYIIGYMSPEVIVTGGDDGSRSFDPMPPPDDEPETQVVPPPPPSTSDATLSQTAFAPEVVETTDEVTIKITETDATPINPDVKQLNNETYYQTENLPEIVEPDPIENMIFKPFEVNELPEFIGGETEMRNFIIKNIKYPIEAKDMSIQGKIYVEFIVSKTGEITNVKLAKSVDPLLDNEALRVVKLMPRWNPGKQSGHNVNVSIIIPIMFTLKR